MTPSVADALREFFAPIGYDNLVQVWEGVGGLVGVSITEDMEEILRELPDDLDFHIDGDGVMWASGDRYELTVDRNAAR
jgi:hypothetical protein